jgi:hypothetical protein
LPLPATFCSASILIRVRSFSAFNAFCCAVTLASIARHHREGAAGGKPSRIMGEDDISHRAFHYPECSDGNT